MASTALVPRYVIISPVKDEERYVELTLCSVAAQTIKPALWVIVDDGSKDATAEIIKRYVTLHSFIRIVHHPYGGARGTGSPVIRAFNYGRSLVADENYDFIVKLDCDLSFEPDYFERLLAEFMGDDRLGIASGIYLEADDNGSWKPIQMPSYHAFGACKVIRRLCFEEIGGFVTAPGWDTLDEIRASSRGWRTCHFAGLHARHHKREGSGIGPLRTSWMHGEIYYLTGGDPLFLVFKTLHRVFARPFVVSGVAMLAGYFVALFGRKPRLVSPLEARSYKKLLRRRMVDRVTNAASRMPSTAG